MDGFHDSPPTAGRDSRLKRSWSYRLGRIARDALVLPPALLLVFIEHVFWAGAKTLLRAIAQVKVILALRAAIVKLPASLVLPLFLIPELISHLGGLWATILLVQRHLLTAALVALFIKGGATLMTVWIYQSCEPTLLSVAWFARLHATIMGWQAWAKERTAAVRRRSEQLYRSNGGRLSRRFAAWRVKLAALLAAKR
ncbi:MAG: hypothetical protein B7Z78_10040 [Rhodospirillales bacterium 20-60-12]|nr:MAG: hypothetical protein B7Z78_10040 [Rhodospirillales bacterium 20-60-12]HQT66553.1 hypothetical protein [Acetobacteraceae bacterium]HQU01130.1 hypothetical protein [Acetobacteraceae bacterium]